MIIAVQIAVLLFGIKNSFSTDRERLFSIEKLWYNRNMIIGRCYRKMSFHMEYLPKADVVFTVMFLNKELCEKTLEVILGEHIELIDIVAEYKNDLHKAALNSVYFDIQTRSVDNRIITLDLQRVYSKERIRKRTIYYACREIASQKVEKSKYEDLESVIVTFILTEAPLKHTVTNRKIKLIDETTHEVYSDLMTIHEVNIKHISEQNSQELQILRCFFEIETEENYQKFVSSYGQTTLGALLLQEYEAAVADPSVLEHLSEEDKYMVRLTEEERLQERAEGREKGLQQGLQQKSIEIAKNLLSEGMTITFISKMTGLSEEEVALLI